MAPEIPSGQDDFYFSDLTPFLQRLIDGYFGPRAKINRERKQVLEMDADFLKDLEIIRLKEKIPRKLSPERDVQLSLLDYDDEAGWDRLSYYIDYSGKEKKARIKRAVKDILKKYSLPLNFYDWVGYFLLYRKFPSGSPRYNWGLIAQVLKDPKEAERIGLSTVEKKSWLKIYRSIQGIGNGRIPKKYEKEYKKLIDSFNKSKNIYRRSRTHDETLEVLDARKEKISFLTEDDVIEKKKTYRDVVAERTNIDTEKETAREAAKYRKRNERSQKRSQKFKKLS